MTKPEVGKFYRHFKGGLYKVVGRAVLAHHYTLKGEEEAVLYERVGGQTVSPVYCRPLSDWCQLVRLEDGREVRRFESAEGRRLG